MKTLKPLFHAFVMNPTEPTIQIIPSLPVLPISIYVLYSNGDTYIDTGITLKDEYDYEFSINPFQLTPFLTQFVPFGSTGYNSNNNALGFRYHNTSVILKWGTNIGDVILENTQPKFGTLQTFSKIGSTFSIIDEFETIATIDNVFDILDTTITALFMAYSENGTPYPRCYGYGQGLRIWSDSTRTNLLFNALAVKTGTQLFGATSVSTEDCFYDTVNGDYVVTHGSGFTAVELDGPLLQSGDFLGDNSYWNIPTTIGTTVIENGEAVCVGVNYLLKQTIYIKEGVSYNLSFDYTETSSDSLRVSTLNDTTDWQLVTSITGTGSGTISGSIIGNGPILMISAHGQLFTGTISNIILTEI